MLDSINTPTFQVGGEGGKEQRLPCILGKTSYLIPPLKAFRGGGKVKVKDAGKFLARMKGVYSQSLKDLIN